MSEAAAKTEHQGLPVGGYRPQPKAAVEAVNGIKVAEEMLLRLVEDAKADAELSADPRWAAIALSHFEQGFMALNRSIFKPLRLTDADIARIGG